MNEPSKAWIALWCHKYAWKNHTSANLDSDDEEEPGNASDSANRDNPVPQDSTEKVYERLASGRAELRKKLGLAALEASDSVLDNARPPEFSKLSDQFEVVSSDIVGRYCVASKPFRTAELVVSSEPVAWCLDSSLIGETCQFCLAAVSSPRVTCPRCPEAVFCNPRCRLAAREYSIHVGKDCSLATKELGPEYKVAIRALLRLRDGQLKETETGLLLALEDNLDLLPGWEQYLMSRTLVSLSFKLGLSTSAESILARLVGIVRSNSFAIKRLSSSSSASTDELTDERLGTALFPDASLLNHSCEPKCAISFREPTPGLAPAIALRTLANVEKGKELSISYGPTVHRTPDPGSRKAALLNSHLFECACEACLSPGARTSKLSLDSLRETDTKARVAAERGDFLGATKLLVSVLPQISLRFGPSSIEHARELGKLLSVALAEPSGAAMKVVVGPDSDGFRRRVEMAISALKAGSFDGEGGEDADVLKGVLGMLGGAL